MRRRHSVKGLGSSILPGGSDAEHPIDSFTSDADSGKIVNVPISEIDPNPSQPRRYFDPESLADLTQSIQDHGVLQPILVRRDPTTNRFIIIAGERRFRASRDAGLTKIPTLIRQREDPDELAIIENLQRQDLTPIEESESLYRLKSQRGLTDETLARIVGKSRSTITETLSLVALPEEVKDECRTSDKYSRNVLLQVVRQPDLAAKMALWEQIRIGSLTVRQARLASNKKAKTARPTPYTYTHQADDETFTVKVQFKKSSVEPEAVRSALLEAIQNLP